MEPCPVDVTPFTDRCRRPGRAGSTTNEGRLPRTAVGPLCRQLTIPNPRITRSDRATL